MRLHRHLVALLPAMSAALILPAPASAGWVDISGATAVAWGEFKYGLWSGLHFPTPPVTTLRIEDLYGDIEPDWFYGSPGQNPGVRLTHYGQDGSNGRDLPFAGEDGGSGAGGLGLRIDLVGPWYDAGGWNQEGGLWTQLWFNHGIVSQSVGGDGGNGGEGYGIVYTPGGDGGHGGSGGAVTVNVSLPADNWNGLWTSGMGAQGVFALSQGGDGGNGGDGYGASVAKGGDGGRGGNGGAVDVAVNLGVGTGGDQSNAILAQSLGGESGYGGVGGGIFGGGGAGSDSGKGGPVNVTMGTAGMTTYGEESHGILAQSVGGGGGYAGISETLDISSLQLGTGARGVSAANTGYGVGFAGSTGGSGSAGAVSVTHTGSITTSGERSHGVLAQSAARSGTAGPVTVTLASSIVANGVDSDGIHVQSVGDGGSGNISVNNGGEVRGGSGAGAGVRIDGGANNTLTNAHGGHISALSGKAVVGGAGNDTIINQGTVAGAVELGGGRNAFHNNSGARFDAGLTVDLGVGNALSNDGILSPGGPGSILSTTLVGNLIQSLGTLEIDVAGFSAGLFDSIDITGTLTGGLDLEGAPVPLGGLVQFSFLAGYDIWTAIAAGQSMEFQFLNVAGNPDVLDASMFSYDFVGLPSGVQLGVFAGDGGLYLEASQVPLPPAGWLFAAALAGLAAARRKA